MGLIPTPEETRAASVGQPTANTGSTTPNATDTSGNSIYVGNQSLNPQFNYSPPQAYAPTAPAQTQGTNVPTGGSGTQTSATPPAGTSPGGNTTALPGQNTAPQGGGLPQSQPSQPTPVFNGSIIDLLNSAGQDSSYQARAQMAKQYGIQGYSGTAAQNTDLANKFMDAFKAKQGSTAPTSMSDAMSQTQDFFNSQDKTQSPAEAQQSFFENYMSMNPAMKSMYDAIGNYFSTANTKTSLVDEYKNMMATEGVSDLKTELLNVNRVMSGTENDIRDEIGRVGGFATESQVQAMTNARNKTLIKQAAGLQDQIAQKEDYIDHIMQFSQADRAQLDKDVSTKLGLYEKMATMESNMNNAATDNYNKIVDNLGYAGLASSFGGNTTAMRKAESLLNLPKGALQNQSFLDAINLKNKKPLDFVSGSKYQQSGVFDPNTGTFKGMGGGGGQGDGGGGTTPPSNAQTSAYYDAFNNAIIGMGPQSVKNVKPVFDSYIQKGDLQGAKNYITSLAIQRAPADQQNQITGRNMALSAMDDIQGLLSAAKAKEVDTNLLTGNLMTAAQKLGTTPDPDLSYIGSRISQALQTYRRAMTGVAFSPGEAAEYTKIFPDLYSIDSLNTAKIAALRDAFNSNNRASLATYMGGSRTYDALYGATQTDFLPSWPGSTVLYNGKSYSVAANGDMTPTSSGSINFGSITIK